MPREVTVALVQMAPDGSRDVLRGNQLNQNYFQNLNSLELVRTTNANDTVDTTL